MSTATDGRRIEHRARHDLETLGWIVFRSAGSKGIADLIAFAPGQVALVQVKRNSPQVSPAERRKLIALANLIHPAEAFPVVAAWQPRKPLHWRVLTGTGPKDWLEWEPHKIWLPFGWPNDKAAAPHGHVAGDRVRTADGWQPIQTLGVGEEL